MTKTVMGHGGCARFSYDLQVRAVIGTFRNGEKKQEKNLDAVIGLLNGEKGEIGVVNQASEDFLGNSS